MDATKDSRDQRISAHLLRIMGWPEALNGLAESVAEEIISDLEKEGLLLPFGGETVTVYAYHRVGDKYESGYYVRNSKVDALNSAGRLNSAFDGINKGKYEAVERDDTTFPDGSRFLSPWRVIS